ncbi:MAG: molybdopterin-dependent oxidoreductase [Deltaproteobacteria bacterium]|nr:molybdopterin-dependent oxidoreductase [Deltaproteobacteria bacterium]
MSEQVFTNCTNAGPVSVYVKDGKVTRMRPLVAEEKDFKPWVIEAGGKNYSPPKKFAVAPYVHADRRRLYSEERIKYPMKRVDFDPNGERNPQNRGKSPYERISWDEALDIVSGEIKRVKETYGGSAISGLTSSHHNWGIVGYKMGPFARFMNLLEFTPVLDNPDSWEGWHWGATHSYGFYWRLGMPEQYDLLEDSLQNAEMIVLWSNDPDSTRGTYTGQDSALWRQWLKEKGVKMVFIDPFHNFTAGVMEGKWIAPRIGADTCIAMAIAQVWITEDIYDKEYVKERTIGFDEFKKYVLGEEDGQEKTPEWAEEESGVKAKVIRALAREWAAKRTILSGGARGGEGGACRQAYGTEWARMMVLLQGMQGLGKPGRTIWGTTMGAPSDTTPVSWYGEGFCGQSLEQQFTHFEYPMEGYSEIKLFYRYGGSFIGTMSDTTKWVRMYQSPKLEFVVNQDIWFNSETRMADIILPACTNFERDDVGEWGACGGYTCHASSGCNYRIVVRQQKCIDPLWESKSDYEIFRLLSERLGTEEEFTDGRSELDWVKAFYESSDLKGMISWEEFDKKGYQIINISEDYKSTPSLRWFAEGRDCDTPDTNNPKRNTEKGKELGTYSGKIEFVSESLKANCLDDDERPLLPHYIPSWEGHHSEMYKKYPLQLLSAHPRFSFHCHYDKHTDWLDDIPVHRIKKDGYAWWPARINPEDAVLRGIQSGDIVRLHNHRASVLCLAVITERIRPGIIHSYASSAKYDPLVPGNADSPDRGGCVNMLTPSRMLSKNVPGMTPNSCLIEIEKWEG